MNVFLKLSKWKKFITYKKSLKKEIFYHFKNSLAYAYAYAYGKKPRAYTFELP